MSEPRELHSTVICVQEGKILFVRKEAPEWSLPGGKLEPDEQPLEAVRRELREETSLTLRNARYLGHHAYAMEEHYLYRMPVECSEVPRASGEIVECRWFTPIELVHVTVKPTNLDLLKRAGQIC
ncbi:NUDIX domain-containing protein [Pseudomonas sp. BW16M2]|uniref:NUDIX domain-containing protein n=1 Tax=Pseudomonas sp. BW16M2 TaxID=2745489 RepID=UPI0016473CA2|nr:NUDIX domain-containing protein [Pseudomonas sp. BW16M2]MBC3437161.1 NUDIX domain-containing protein [Pseudomonas sp. BW16M2]